MAILVIVLAGVAVVSTGASGRRALSLATAETTARQACSLDKAHTGVCAQALWERRWLVEVRSGRKGPAAQILKVSSGPSSRA